MTGKLGKITFGIQESHHIRFEVKIIPSVTHLTVVERLAGNKWFYVLIGFSTDFITIRREIRTEIVHNGFWCGVYVGIFKGF